MSEDSKAQRLEWVRQWKEAGQALARVRASDVRGANPDEVALSLEAAFRVSVVERAKSTDSGLVKQQAILHRLAK